MRKRNEEKINIWPSLNNFLCIWPGSPEIWPGFREIWPGFPEIWQTVDCGAKETARHHAALFNLINSQINETGLRIDTSCEDIVDPQLYTTLDHLVQINKVNCRKRDCSPILLSFT